MNKNKGGDSAKRIDAAAKKKHRTSYEARDHFTTDLMFMILSKQLTYENCLDYIMKELNVNQSNAYKYRKEMLSKYKDYVSGDLEVFVLECLLEIDALKSEAKEAAKNNKMSIRDSLTLRLKCIETQMSLRGINKATFSHLVFGKASGNASGNVSYYMPKKEPIPHEEIEFKETIDD